MTNTIQNFENIINEILLPCQTECIPSERMGRSWYKQLGYGSACYCAHTAKVKQLKQQLNDGEELATWTAIPYCENKCVEKCFEMETCESCRQEFRIGCATNPSDDTLYNGFCDDCRYHMGKCKFCSKENEGDWDELVDDSVCVDCSAKYTYDCDSKVCAEQEKHSCY